MLQRNQVGFIVIILALGRLKQKDKKIEANLRYTGKAFLNSSNNKKKRTEKEEEEKKRGEKGERIGGRRGGKEGERKGRETRQ